MILQSISHPGKKWTGELNLIVGDMNWAMEIARQLGLSTSNSIRIDISRIDFIPLFEWQLIISNIELLLIKDPTRDISIDLFGSNSTKVLPPEKFDEAKYKYQNTPENQEPLELQWSRKIYKKAGFLEYMGTTTALRCSNNGIPRALVYYTYLSDRQSNLENYHKKREDSTKLLGCRRISTKKDCHEYLDDTVLLLWKEEMAAKFRDLPIFGTNEIWRLFCHELAVNVHEHSGSSGHLSGRIVMPLNADGSLRPWCKNTYPQEMHNLLSKYDSSFIELSISDAGIGINQSLLESYKARLEAENISEDIYNDHIDIRVLQFAFDDLGTSKDKEESWETDRHALGTMLHLINKYGGAVRIMSGKADLIYFGGKNQLNKRFDKLGYEPDHKKQLTKGFRGTHIQFLIPLTPHIDPKYSHTKTLVDSLPDSYRLDPDHPIGTLFPVSELTGQKFACTGGAQQRAFRKACSRIVKDISDNHASMEPLIFDFSDVYWRAPQLKTFLSYLHSIIQKRAALLVGLNSILLEETVELEEQQNKSSIPALLNEAKPVEYKSKAIHTDRDICDPYSQVGSPIIAIDTDKNVTILGVLNTHVRNALNKLVNSDQPLSIVELSQLEGTTQNNVAHILSFTLNASSVVFVHSLSNAPIDPKRKWDEIKWQCIWSRSQLDTECTRALTQNYDLILKNCEAWHGRKSKSHLYYLPWNNNWRDDFLESGRILSRERYADEAAVRMIHALQSLTEEAKYGFGEIRTIVGLTSPSVLLAYAMYRRWPSSTKPAVADLGWYSLKNPNDDIPLLSATNDIVIIQDVMDTNKVSGSLLEALQSKGYTVFAIVSLFELVKKGDPLGVHHGLTLRTLYPKSETKSETKSPTYLRSVIKVPRPKEVAEPNEDKPSRDLHFVEPRALRPFRLSSLRREPKEINKGDTDTKAAHLQAIFSPTQHPIIRAGHYIFGTKHFSTVIDFRTACDGDIGRNIADWIANMCVGPSNLESPPWEDSSRDGDFKGDATALLIPIHSQAHYLWPSINRRIVQRRKRVPIMLLDATLFIGDQVYYRIPLQLEKQIRQVAVELGRAYKAKLTKQVPRIKLVIFDDAISTGNTAETIITALQRTTEKAFLTDDFDTLGLSDDQVIELPNPIEWIQFTVAFNTMHYSRRARWKDISTVFWRRPVSFRFQRYATLDGIESHREDECPYCRDLTRITDKYNSSQQRHCKTSSMWLKDQIDLLKANAIDCHFLTPPKPTADDGTLQFRVLPYKNGSSKHVFTDVDVAISWFYHLMHLSYPLKDPIRAILDQPMDEKYEHHDNIKYRLAVFRWCLHNWNRVCAFESRKIVLEIAERDYKSASPACLPEYEILSMHANDPHIQYLIASSLYRTKYQLSVITKKSLRTNRLNALEMFFLGVTHEDICTPLHKEGAPRHSLQHYLINTLRLTKKNSRLRFLIRNLQIHIDDTISGASAGFALMNVAEILFRGRSRDRVEESHEFLPHHLRLAVEKRDQNSVKLIADSLAIFLGNLRTLSAHAELEAADVIDFSEQVLENFGNDQIPLNTLPCIRHLKNSVDLNSTFVRRFNQILHRKATVLKQELEDHYTKSKAKLTNLEFIVTLGKGTEYTRLLIPYERLFIHILNYAIDPVQKLGSSEPEGIELKSKVRIDYSSKGQYPMLKFTILTNFRSHEDTLALFRNNSNAIPEISILTGFGAIEDELPLTPAKQPPYKTKYEFWVPLGYNIDNKES